MNFAIKFWRIPLSSLLQYSNEKDEIQTLWLITVTTKKENEIIHNKTFSKISSYYLL